MAPRLCIFSFLVLACTLIVASLVHTVTTLQFHACIFSHACSTCSARPSSLRREHAATTNYVHASAHSISDTQTSSFLSRAQQAQRQQCEREARERAARQQVDQHDAITLQTSAHTQVQEFEPVGELSTQQQPLRQHLSRHQARKATASYGSLSLSC